MEPTVGIKLRTTNSAVAHLTPDGLRVIPIAVGGRFAPFVVGIAEDRAVRVGGPPAYWWW